MSVKSWDIKIEKCCFTQLSCYTEHNPHKYSDKDKTDKCTTNLPAPKDKKIGSVLLEHNSRLLQQ